MLQRVSSASTAKTAGPAHLTGVLLPTSSSVTREPAGTATGPPTRRSSRRCSHRAPSAGSCRFSKPVSTRVSLVPPWISARSKRTDGGAYGCRFGSGLTMSPTGRPGCAAVDLLHDHPELAVGSPAEIPTPPGTASNSDCVAEPLAYQIRFGDRGPDLFDRRTDVLDERAGDVQSGPSMLFVSFVVAEYMQLGVAHRHGSCNPLVADELVTVVHPPRALSTISPRPRRTAPHDGNDFDNDGNPGDVATRLSGRGSTMRPCGCKLLAAAGLTGRRRGVSVQVELADRGGFRRGCPAAAGRGAAHPCRDAHPGSPGEPDRRHVRHRVRGLHRADRPVVPGAGDHDRDDRRLGRRPDCRHAAQSSCHSMQKALATVGTSAVQEVVAGAPMQDCARTMVVTNNEFTPAARKLAELHGCVLVGGAELTRLKSVIKELLLT